MFRKGLISLLICLAIFYSKAQDTTAPILHSISVFPTIVNAGDSITVTIEITDDISGIKGMGFPNGGLYGTDANLWNNSRTHWVPAIEWTHISGNTYKSTVLIPTEVPGGNWEVGSLYAIDLSGNVKIYRDSIDFFARFTVNSSFVITDTTPPQLLSFSILTDTVIVPGNFYASVNVFDSESGFNTQYSRMYLSNPNCSKKYFTGTWTIDSLGNWETNRFLNMWTTGGNWIVDSIELYDNAQNKKLFKHGVDYIGNFFVVENSPDCFPPDFFSVSIIPNVLHRGDNLSVHLEMRDTISGLRLRYAQGGSPVEVGFSNSFGQQQYSIDNFSSIQNGNMHLGNSIISEYAANGIWEIDKIYISDVANNSFSLNSWQLSNLNRKYEVIPDSMRIIEGTVLTSDSLPLKNSRVFMIKQNPVDSSIYVMRLAFTDTAGYYKFESEKRDSIVYFKAIPDVNLYPNQIPTYLDTTTLFTNARMVRVSNILSTVDTFHTLQGINEGGFGLISGYLSDGAGKSSSVALANMDLILADISGEPINGTKTNSNGNFSFQNIPDGTYIIYPAVRNPDFSKAPILYINDSSRYLSLDFVFLNDHIALETNSIESIELNYLKVYPNPTNNKLFVEHRNIKPSNIELYDILGKSIDINVNSHIDKEILDLANIREGIYFLKASMKSGDSKVFRILIE